MKLTLVLFSFSIIIWQAIKISATLANRLQERTNQFDYVLTEYMERN